MQFDKNCATKNVYATPHEADYHCIGPYLKPHRLVPYQLEEYYNPDAPPPPACVQNSTCSCADPQAKECRYMFFDPSLNRPLLEMKGLVSDYDYSGYRLSIPLDKPLDYTTSIQEGFDGAEEWLDGNTVAVVGNLKGYAVNTMAFVDVSFLVEFSPYGVVFPSWEVSSVYVTDLISTDVEKCLVVVYLWLTVVIGMSYWRLYKRYKGKVKLGDSGLIFLDLMQGTFLLMACCGYLALYANPQRRALLSKASYADVTSYLDENEQALVVIEDNQKVLRVFEVLMPIFTAVEVFYLAVLLTRRSTFALFARTFWNNKCYFFTFYCLLLFLVLMAVVLLFPRVGENIEIYMTEMQLYSRLLSYFFQMLSVDVLRFILHSDAPDTTLTVLILVTFLVLIRLFYLPLFRAHVAQSYLQESFDSQHKESTKYEKHRCAHYWMSLLDDFHVHSKNKKTAETLKERAEPSKSDPAAIVPMPGGGDAETKAAPEELEEKMGETR